ncbi:uncharacterized protein LOC143253702 [Tachypleus tridentatus]|uniref:uncharacterized protein LOC143253702 n=1 Tax=Tachypleus tridentatus TaxID=6853 RepID=UPI003FD0993B
MNNEMKTVPYFVLAGIVCFITTFVRGTGDDELGKLLNGLDSEDETLPFDLESSNRTHGKKTNGTILLQVTEFKFTPPRPIIRGQNVTIDTKIITNEVPQVQYFVKQGSTDKPHISHYTVKSQPNNNTFVATLWLQDAAISFNVTIQVITSKMEVTKSTTVIVRGSLIGGFCVEDNSCDTKHSICVNSTCVCKAEEFFVAYLEDSSQACLKAADLNESCETDKQCITSNAICRPNICTCMDDFVSNSQKKCELKERKHKMAWWGVLLIVVAVTLVLVGILYTVYRLRKRKSTV